MTITGAGTNVRPPSPGQHARLLVGDIDGGEPRLVYGTADSALEAPNWSPDSRHFAYVDHPVGRPLDGLAGSA